MAGRNTKKAEPVFDRGSPGSSTKDDKMDAKRGTTKKR